MPGACLAAGRVFHRCHARYSGTGKRRGQKQISDPVLLRKIILFLADNIGNSTSLNTIANTLTSENMPEGRGRRDEEKMYFQVTEDMGAEAVRQREPGPLMDVRDNYEKAVIALNAPVTASVEGIKIIRLMDFLPA